MGKYHWKVEKQPEWYVKAVRKTIAALPGGYAEAADWLDVTENALFNRLRADGDQIFPLGWAMVLQRAAGTHYIADAVAQSAGGVFVSLPEIEEVENADINQRLLEVIEQIGNYSKQIRSAIEDGVVEPEEISLKLYQKPSRKKSVRGVTRKHQTVRLQSPSAMIITLTARLLFRPLFLTV